MVLQIYDSVALQQRKLFFMLLGLCLENLISSSDDVSFHMLTKENSLLSRNSFEKKNRNSFPFFYYKNQISIILKFQSQK